MACISCGFRKDKYILCDKCNGTVCIQCITKGLCKDCFVLIEARTYTSQYKYKEKVENYV